MTGNRDDLVLAEPAPGSQPLEVVCDESGYEGEKLVGGTTDVFAHASMRLDTASAAACMRELRERIRSPATEYKANHLLRQRHRSVLTWLLGPSGPLYGHGRVYLIDKSFFAVGRVVDLLVGEAGRPAGIGLYQGEPVNAMAVTLYREGQRTFPRDLWDAFLVSSNNLMRTTDRLDGRESVETFFHSLEELRLAGAPGPVDDILRLLQRARHQADVARAQLVDNGKATSALDPLIPAIVQAVVHWGADGHPVAIVHDRQNTLSAERIAQFKQLIGRPHPALSGGSPSGRLASLNLAASHSDVRIQLADILAGTARKIASEELNGRGDAELTALLPPYVDPGSIWGDDRSWSRLRPPDQLD